MGVDKECLSFFPLPWEEEEEEEPLPLTSSSSSSSHFWIPKKSIIFFWEKPKTQNNKNKILKKCHTFNATFIIKQLKKKKISFQFTNTFNSIQPLTSHSLLFLPRTLRAKPRSNRDPNHDWPHAFHVESFVAFVTQKQLLRRLAGPALFAAQVAVILALHDGVSRLRHYLRHRLVLLRRRRVPRRREPRRLSPPAEADEPLSRQRRWWWWGGRSHGREWKIREGSRAETEIEKRNVFCVRASSFLYRGRREWCVVKKKIKIKKKN